MLLSATPWSSRTQLPLGFFGRTFQPRRRAPSCAGTSKSSRLAPVTAKEASASRMSFVVNSRRMGWRNAGPASHPATAARSGGKSNKIRAMRRRRRRMGAYPKDTRMWSIPFGRCFGNVPSRRGYPQFFVKESGIMHKGVKSEKGSDQDNEVPEGRVAQAKTQVTRREAYHGIYRGQEGER